MILTVLLVLPQAPCMTLELALVHTTCPSSSLSTRYLCHIWASDTYSEGIFMNSCLRSKPHFLGFFQLFVEYKR